jgi:S-DNA-T family DNA segregation ATPase FtsK/SpoIIIE
MIDPKTLELGVYDNIPHLLIPVVKDPQKAHNALNWATEEMTRRYGILAQKGVRNIAQYNDAIRDFQEHQHPDDLFSQPREEPLPYIVIIIDELADLMMVSAGVEKPITRLAQMARAVGIHLVLATQRPSVDVITGVIKANFPARISFRVSSKVDSRTILDANGAELLLGDGDMLFLLPGTSRIRRLHGSFVTEKEIKRLTTALKKMGKPQYDQSVLQYASNGNTKEGDDAELYRKAVHLVVNSGEASISMLRRVLKIGHSRAARLIDTMEQDGIVGQFRGSRPRDILLTPDQVDERFPDQK